jgi:hypothetical protein
MAEKDLDLFIKQSTLSKIADSIKKVAGNDNF